MLPEIQTIETNDRTISRFLGLNQKDTSTDEMFKNMKNMTSDEYPYLTPRDKSAIRQVFSGDTSMVYGSCVYGEDVYTVQGQKISGVDTIYFYKNFTKINAVNLTQELKIRTLVIYGANIVIFPDNVMYNTKDGTVTNLSYTLNVNNSSSYLYLSDKDGIPFACDTETVFYYGSDSSYYGRGLYGVLSSTTQYDLDTATYPSWDADLRIHNAISNSGSSGSTLFNLTKFLPRRPREKDDGSITAQLRQINIVFSRKDFLSPSSYSKYLTYKTFYGFTDTEGNLNIMNYNSSQNMYTPAELYVSYAINYTSYNDIKDKIKIGDFIKITGLKSDGSEYSKSDFSGNPAFWNIVKTFKNRVKVENIIECRKESQSDPDKVVLVFSNNTLKFDEALKEDNRIIKASYHHTNSGGAEEYLQEIKKINNYLGFGYGTVSHTIVHHAKVEKDVPEMDFITVSNNRIWGCSSDNHEIYSCKQGDATSWYNYSGLASDSYAVTIPNGDKFTGAVTYSDMPYFFTENCAYSIMGNKPKNFQVQTYELRGVAKGAYSTIAQKDGYVYYKSKDGIERFNGNNSQNITEYLDLECFDGVCGAINNDKYYVFLGKSTVTTKLYVYDIKKAIWHIERDYMPNYLINLDGNLYILNGVVGKVYLEKIAGKGYEEASVLVNNTPTYDNPKWFVESGEFNAGSVLNKYITKFMFEMKIEEGSKVSIEFMYNDSGEWLEVFKSTDDHVKKLVKVPILVRRCERLRYKIKGIGKAKIYTITITYEGGSELDG
jgi:hypothetical protein